MKFVSNPEVHQAYCELIEEAKAIDKDINDVITVGAEAIVGVAPSKKLLLFNILIYSNNAYKLFNKKYYYKVYST